VFLGASAPFTSEKKMVMILLGLVIVGMVIAYIKLEKTNNKLKQEYQQLKNINISLEKDIRDQVNKNIILESLLKQRPNQNEDRKIY
jgi:cell division protein FtsB